MADFEVKLTGLDPILAKMRKLPDAIGNRAMRRALRKGANVIRGAARRNAQSIDDPQTRENIAKNIAVQAASRRREKSYGGPTMRVGVMGGARMKADAGNLPGGNTTHWRHVEMGTSGTKAQPFLRPAAQQGEQALAQVVAAMDAEAGKELTKLGIK
jgi:HK97 gp10 family phage protein